MADDLALVVKALQIGIRGCVEWDHHEYDRVQRELALFELSPELILDEVVQHVRRGGAVRQVPEKREEKKVRRDYYYKIILPMPDLFKKGLFVEMELVNRDEDYPEIRLVNAHEQS